MPATGPQWVNDVADDFLYPPEGLETVEFRRLLAAGTYAAAADVRARREEPSRRSAAGLMEAADVVWHLYVPDLTAAGITWAIDGDKVTDATGTEWRCRPASSEGRGYQLRVPSMRIPPRSA